MSADRIPEALFLEPDAGNAVTEASMTRDEYRREVAKCIMEAASKGMIETVYLSRPRKPLQSLTEMSGALALLDRLVEHDMNRRQWMAVEFLSPEINHVVQCLRDYGRYEAFVQSSTEHLAVLKGTVSTHGTEPDLTEPSGEEIARVPARQ